MGRENSHKSCNRRVRRPALGVRALSHRLLGTAEISEEAHVRRSYDQYPRFLPPNALKKLTLNIDR